MIGTTTFGFRYSFMDPANSPKLAEVIRQAREAGVERLQVCENTRPLEMSPAEWAEARRCAAELGVELLLGCKTLRPAVVERYLRLAQELSCDHLRIVMEEPPEHANRDNVARLLEAIVPRMQRAGLRLAIENHFDIPSAILLELASAYPPEHVGFCVDTANSLRSIESAGEVIRLLRERACFYHLKDYQIVGSLISFSVVARLLGKAVVLKADSQGEMSGTFFTAGLARAGVSGFASLFRLFLRVRNRVLTKADAFVAITPDVAAEFADEGIALARVRTVPNGVDTSRFRPLEPEARAALRRRLAIDPDVPVAVYTGRLVSYKGLPLLIRAFGPES